jgi:hypothetical protein
MQHTTNIQHIYILHAAFRDAQVAFGKHRADAERLRQRVGSADTDFFFLQLLERRKWRWTSIARTLSGCGNAEALTQL